MFLCQWLLPFPFYHSSIEERGFLRTVDMDTMARVGTAKVKPTCQLQKLLNHSPFSYFLTSRATQIGARPRSHTWAMVPAPPPIFGGEGSPDNFSQGSIAATNWPVRSSVPNPIVILVSTMGKHYLFKNKNFSSWPWSLHKRAFAILGTF
jgi:hypothetical protein